MVHAQGYQLIGAAQETQFVAAETTILCSWLPKAKPSPFNFGSVPADAAFLCSTDGDGHVTLTTKQPRELVAQIVLVFVHRTFNILTTRCHCACINVNWDSRLNARACNDLSLQSDRTIDLIDRACNDLKSVRRRCRHS